MTVEEYAFAWRLRFAFQITLGLFVDVGEWIGRQVYRRRISIATVKHRAGGENTISVWDVIRSNEESEFGLTPIVSHRDRRGWRYGPKVWYILQRIWDDQKFAERTAETVESLLEEIRWMLANPVVAVTEHGAVRSEYRAVALWKAMQA